MIDGVRGVRKRELELSPFTTGRAPARLMVVQDNSRFLDGAPHAAKPFLELLGVSIHGLTKYVHVNTFGQFDCFSSL